jgi:hypothetical protein
MKRFRQADQDAARQSGEVLGEHVDRLGTYSPLLPNGGLHLFAELLDPFARHLFEDFARVDGGTDHFEGPMIVLFDDIDRSMRGLCASVQPFAPLADRRRICKLPRCAMTKLIAKAVDIAADRGQRGVAIANRGGARVLLLTPKPLAH